MKDDLLQRIQELMPQFSKSQKLIAGYILEHYEKAAYMTALKLGNAVNVSESTVVRFAIELGYEGYPQLQRSLQSHIKNRLTSLQRMDVTRNRIGDMDQDKAHHQRCEQGGFRRGGERDVLRKADIYSRGNVVEHSGAVHALLSAADTG